MVLYEELVDGTKSDQLSGSCDGFNLTYLPVITPARHRPSAQGAA